MELDYDVIDTIPKLMKLVDHIVHLMNHYVHYGHKDFYIALVTKQIIVSKYLIF